jgi:hypothetical protein
MGVTLLSNRAACYHKTGECRLSVADCDVALEMGGSDAKLLLRRAAANEVRERFRDVYLDYKLVLNMFPGNQAAQQGVARAQKGLEFTQDWKWLTEQKATPQSVVPPRFAPAPTSPAALPKFPKSAPTSAPVATTAKAADAEVKSGIVKKTVPAASTTTLNSAALAYDELKVVLSCLFFSFLFRL